MGTRLIATGSYLPKTSLSNDDLTNFLDTSDEWIYKRTGIQKRHIATDENTSDLGAKAALNALEKVDISPEEIGFIIVATMSPDFISPSTACLIQEKIGAINAFAFDVSAACSGFIYALTIADSMFHTQSCEYGMVIGAEVMSKMVDWSDRKTSVLFGDGAGCVILKKDSQNSIMYASLNSDGAHYKALTANEQPVQNALCTIDSKHHALDMDGRAIFNFATKQVPIEMLDALQQTSLKPDMIDYYVCHQANARMIDIFAKKLKQPIEKFPMNISRLGNTSSASIPILLDELCQTRYICLDGTKTVMMTGFGGGLTWGTLIINI
ncbi:beta-ketoacyl-ACP synthase III [Granulicatella sp. zg-ZJ]|uniref:beta-ketoacyl-ACP synthase III n=1 Tax=Granulicatella sp. zg-ZJ TaxID=2678504 RepID=UPI0013D1FB73|nr:beta-ketoacyl-ACP synthase III [Granulicatella sp. zg-ZJ]NEW62187.1 beta-ketoacyl-ACP synthase III [Granulicatella sp. zg-ZJ]